MSIETVFIVMCTLLQEMNDLEYISQVYPSLVQF